MRALLLVLVILAVAGLCFKIPSGRAQIEENRLRALRHAFPTAPDLQQVFSDFSFRVGLSSYTDQERKVVYIQMSGEAGDFDEESVRRVFVHELVHAAGYADHSREFWDVLQKFEARAEASGFLTPGGGIDATYPSCL